MELDEIKGMAKKKGVQLEFSLELREFLYSKSFQEAEELGVKKIKIIISSFVINPLSFAMISFTPSRIDLDVNKGNLVIDFPISWETS